MSIEPAAYVRTTAPLDLSQLPEADSGRYHSVWVSDHLISLWPDAIWTPEFTELATVSASPHRHPVQVIASRIVMAGELDEGLTGRVDWQQIARHYLELSRQSIAATLQSPFVNDPRVHHGALSRGRRRPCRNAADL